MTNKTMLTDEYQLTMMASYLDNNIDDKATFDMFIRGLPEDWGYFIANGIEDAIDYATSIKFSKDDIDFLRSQGKYSEDFLDFLRGFRFNGEIYSVKEGEIVFPNQPVLRVTGSRTEAQFLETAILNIINFQTMVASKANRVVNAAGESTVLDFGLRRAQGEDAGMEGARAAYIGGASGTSNVKAGKEYGIPTGGTQAHSYVMSFDDEADAFRAYAKTFPDRSVFLIDTYNTLEGAEKAAIVAKEMEKQGHRLVGVRLDSGDLEMLSKGVRDIFNSQGLGYVKIYASNDLNEYKIEDLVRNGAKIDAFGVGTEMITAKPVSAISGVYKLVEDTAGPKMKFSPGKESNPGKKQIYRISDEKGTFLYDVMALESEKIEGRSLLEKVVENGFRISQRRDLKEIREYALDSVSRLPDSLKQVRVADKYEVRKSEGLTSLIDELGEKYLQSLPFYSVVHPISINQ